MGSFYPFSVFPMYAAAPGGDRAARLGARTGDGSIVELTRFAAFDCDTELDPDAFTRACGDAYAPRYIDDELVHHVRSHAAALPDGDRIEIVRRVWTLASDGSVSSADCVLARCRAAP